MGQAVFDWESFWDITTPEDAARILFDWYGARAARIAAECGLAAHGDDREEDYRFWYAVFARLRADETDLPGPRAQAGT
jgi:hypothetical protein